MGKDFAGEVSSTSSFVTSNDSDRTSTTSVVSEGSGGSGDDRQAWGGQLEFLLTCISYAVGLGNVWRFPYLCYQNGGGAFLIPYIIVLVLVGLPLFFMELSFGQFASSGPLSIWTINPLFKGVGMASISVVWIIVLYFNIIISWCLYYLFASMTSEIPWMTCGHDWNTEWCAEQVNATLPEAEREKFKTPSEEYFYNHVLQISDSIDDFGGVRPELAGYLLLCWVIIFLVLIKGINSLGKVSYVVSIFPYIVLTILLVHGATLPGAANGVTYYIKPEWEKLASLKVWGDAAGQIFYSVGICLGSLIAMASYNKFHNNTLRDSMIVPPINCFTSIYSGFVIFAVLGYMAHIKNVDIDKVAADGPGLVFVVYPEALGAMPVPQLWSILFFTMMCLIGFGSQFSQAETVITAFLDQFDDVLRTGRRPIIFRFAFCVFGYLVSLPMVCNGGFYLFQIVDTYSANYQLLIIALCELFALMVAYGFHRFCDDIELMLGRQPPAYFKFCWCVTCPIIILLVIVLKIMQETGTLSLDGQVFPAWTMSISWLLVAFPLSLIVGYMIGRFLYDGGWQAIKKASAARRSWGPANPQNRTGRYMDPEIARDSLRHPAYTENSGHPHDIILSLPNYDQAVGIKSYKF